MNSKFTLALIALVGVGVFALPSTMALFAGQHSFYNIDATGNQVPCVKCHGDVKAELSSGGNTLTGTPGPHANFKCEYCHRAEAGEAAGDDAYVRITYSDAAGVAKDIYLVTTLGNYESGNFPGTIKIGTDTTVTVDNFSTIGYDINGTNQFSPQITNTSENGYEGSLSTDLTANTVYQYNGASERALYSGGAPIDKNSNTTGTAFNARAVTWNATGQSENLTGAGSREVTPGTRYHAASLVSCLECHGGDQYKGVAGYTIYQPKPYNHAGFVIDKTDGGGCSDCHYTSNPDGPAGVKDQLVAGGFGLTDYANDTGSLEAHNDFVRADGGVLRKGYGAANDACVACHTHVAVDINFQKKYALKFDADAFQGGAYQNNTNTARTGAWGVGNFQAQGTVTVEEFGNGTGGAFATSNKSYNWANWTSTLYLINGSAGNGSVIGQVQGLNNDANDSAGALTSP